MAIVLVFVENVVETILLSSKQLKKSVVYVINKHRLCENRQEYIFLRMVLN